MSEDAPHVNVGVRVSTAVPFAGVRRTNPVGGLKSMETLHVWVASRGLPTPSIALTDQVCAPWARVAVGVLQVPVMPSRFREPSMKSW